MLETPEQDARIQELGTEYPHGVGVAMGNLIVHGGAPFVEYNVPLAFLTCHDAQARPVHREIVLPDGTRFVEGARALSPDVLAAVRRIVAYNWSDESRDFDEQTEGDRKGHVFADLVRVRAALEA